MTYAYANNIPVIQSTTNYWIVRSGVENKYFENFAMNEYIAMGWDRISNIENLKNIMDIRSLKRLVLEKYPEIRESPDRRSAGRKISDISNKIYRFINDLKIGDIIVTPGKDDILIGEIIGEPYLVTNNAPIPCTTKEEELIGELNKARKVNWLKRMQKKELEPNLKLVLGIIHGVAHIESEQVITEVNRSIYNFYERENKGHSIFKVKTQEEIDFEKYAFFINSIQNIYNLLKEGSDNQKLYIKTNVQSPGPIELIGETNLLKQLVIAARIIFKNDDNALQEINSERQRQKILELKENFNQEFDYEDYEFPSHGTY